MRILRMICWTIPEVAATLVAVGAGGSSGPYRDRYTYESDYVFITDSGKYGSQTAGTYQHAIQRPHGEIIASRKPSVVCNLKRKVLFCR